MYLLIMILAVLGAYVVLSMVISIAIMVFDRRPDEDLGEALFSFFVLAALWPLYFKDLLRGRKW